MHRTVDMHSETKFRNEVYKMDFTVMWGKNVERKILGYCDNSPFLEKKTSQGPQRANHHTSEI